ncbi:MAG: hypothetical protein ACI8R9_001009 [Paraglaciecola sp.]
MSLKTLIPEQKVTRWSEMWMTTVITQNTQ